MAKQTLRPPTNVTLLSGTPSMAEFTSWKKSWEDYSLINHVDQHDIATQLAALRTHMSPDFQAVFAESVTVDSTLPNEPTVAEAITAIHKFIRGVQNIVVDRFQFFTRRQQPGESFEHFFVALRQLCRLADVCNHCTDTQLITLIIIGVQDPELQKKLLEIRPAPNLNQILTACRAFESAGTDQALTSSVVAHAGRQEKSLTYNTNSRPLKSQQQNHNARAYKNTTCYWCAGEPHPSRSQCPAKDTTCNFCLIKGHYQKACKKRITDRSTEKSIHKAVNTAKVMEATIRSGIAPIPIHVNASGREVQIMAYPDTGADISILPEKYLHKFGTIQWSLTCRDGIRITVAIICTYQPPSPVQDMERHGRQARCSTTPTGKSERTTTPTPTSRGSMLDTRPIHQRWSSIGRIIQAQHRNYTVKMPSGRILWRNRRHIRPYSGDDAQSTQTAAPRSGCYSPRKTIPPLITPAETTEFTPESLEWKNHRFKQANDFIPRRSPRLIQAKTPK
jgi:hypothetical protein